MTDTSLREILVECIQARVGGKNGTAMVLSRLSDAEQQCLEELLRGVPPEGGSASRKMLERVVATAFQSGAVHAVRFVEHADI